MKAAGAAADRLLVRPPADLRLLLLYGPDESLARERLATFTSAVLDGPADPFNLVDLDGSAVASDPSRLADEAAAIPMLGGRKLIRIRDAGEEIFSAVENLLGAPAAGNPVAVIAGNLKAGSKLRKIAESDPRAFALSCYPEQDSRATAQLDQLLSECGIELDRDARDLLVRSAGAERGILRREIEKLSLYLGSSPQQPARASAEDLTAIGADFGQGEFSRMIDSVLNGQLREAAEQSERMVADGTAGIALLRALLARLFQLLEARARMEAGETAESAVQKLRPPLFWKDVTPVTTQLAWWQTDSISDAILRVSAAERMIKAPGSSGDLLAIHTILGLAGRAARAKSAGRPRR